MVANVKIKNVSMFVYRPLNEGSCFFLTKSSKVSPIINDTQIILSLIYAKQNVFPII
jgi:hypothetical protein